MRLSQEEAALKVEMYQGLLELNWNLLFSAVTVLVLFLILKKFFFEKVHNFMEKREQEVIDSFENAKKTQEEADSVLAEYKSQLRQAEAEKQRIIKEARADAEEQASEIMREAKEDIDAQRNRFRIEMKNERTQAEEEIKREMSSMVIMAAKKVLGSELDEEKQKSTIEAAMKEAEDNYGSR